MADIHILAGDGRKHWQVAFHLDVPDADNDVGVNYRTALANTGSGLVSVMPEGSGPGQITTAELIRLATGEVFEHVENIRSDTHGQTPASQRASLKAAYAKAELDVLKNLKRQLKYFGHTESR